MLITCCLSSRFTCVPTCDISDVSRVVVNFKKNACLVFKFHLKNSKISLHGYNLDSCKWLEEVLLSYCLGPQGIARK